LSDPHTESVGRGIYVSGLLSGRFYAVRCGSSPARAGEEAEEAHHGDAGFTGSGAEGDADQGTFYAGSARIGFAAFTLPRKAGVGHSQRC